MKAAPVRGATVNPAQPVKLLSSLFRVRGALRVRNHRNITSQHTAIHNLDTRLRVSLLCQKPAAHQFPQMFAKCLLGSDHWILRRQNGQVFIKFVVISAVISLLLRNKPKPYQLISPPLPKLIQNAKQGVLSMPAKLITNNWKTPNFYAIIFLLNAAILERNTEWVEHSAEPVRQFINLRWVALLYHMSCEDY